MAQDNSNKLGILFPEHADLLAQLDNTGRDYLAWGGFDRKVVSESTWRLVEHALTEATDETAQLIADGLKENNQEELRTLSDLVPEAVTGAIADMQRRTRAAAFRTSQITATELVRFSTEDAFKEALREAGVEVVEMNSVSGGKELIVTAKDGYSATVSGNILTLTGNGQTVKFDTSSFSRVKVNMANVSDGATGMVIQRGASPVSVSQNTVSGRGSVGVVIGGSGKPRNS